MGNPGEWKQQCYDAANNKKWPLCIWNLHCVKVQSAIDTYCSGTEKTPGTPVSQMALKAFYDDADVEQEHKLRGHIVKDGPLDNAVIDPTGKEPVLKDPSTTTDPKGLCWCCCSCFAYDTPIEAQRGKYVFIQNIQVGDKIMAAGADLDWKETEVNYSSGIGPNLKFPFMYYLTYQCEGDENKREMIVSADHLFMMASGRLKPVQHIIPGNKLRQADGKVATVVFCVVGEYTGGLHHIHMGDFDGKNLDGHLINANGIICADYMVQVHYSSGGLNPDLITDPPEDTEPLEVGTDKYHQVFGNDAVNEFLSKPELWPTGLKPRKTDLINIPSNAHSFLTKKQAGDIKDHAKFSSYGSAERISTVKYLFSIYKTFYPNIVYLFDWDNELPNAYTWSNMGQNIILITGGLARVIGLDQEGIALVIAHLVSVCRGNTCVGQADYDATFYVLREVWNDTLYGVILFAALEQIEKLFGYVSEKHAAEDPDDVCAQPSLKCRIASFNAGGSMMPVPKCGLPKPEVFEVVGAKASLDLKSVLISFNHQVDQETAEKQDNYEIMPAIKIQSAVMNKHNHSVVRIHTDELAPGSDYTVTVKNVLSFKKTSLNPQAASASFHCEETKCVGVKNAK